MKVETIIEPTPEIRDLQEKLLQELSASLPNSHVELVGAMAVPMAGRPELDFMIISNKVADDSKKLEEGGYKQGPVVKETSFLKKMEEGIEIGIQIMTPGSKMIGIHRNIIKKLQEDEELKNRYEDFKRTLSGLTREEYKKQKSVWIVENILPRK